MDAGEGDVEPQMDTDAHGWLVGEAAVGIMGSERAGGACAWAMGVGGGMALLYYWRPDNYRRDLDFGAGFHLNQGSAVLHRVEVGE
jgi:hypothetical protein